MTASPISSTRMGDQSTIVPTVPSHLLEGLTLEQQGTVKLQFAAMLANSKSAKMHSPELVSLIVASNVFSARSDFAAADSEKHAVEAEKHFANSERLSSEAVRHAVAAEGHRIDKEGHRADKEKHIAELEKLNANVATAQKGIQNALAQKFHQIFINSRTPLSNENCRELFAKYLSDGSITVEDIADKVVYKIRSIASIISYLNDHPEAKMVNLSGFQAIDELQEFANFLKTATMVRKIGIKSGTISEEGQRILEEAAVARTAAGAALQITMIP